MGRRIGEMACLNPACDCKDAAVEETTAGNWQARCHKCGFPTYSKAGTRWRRDMERLVRLDDDERPAPTAPRSEDAHVGAPAAAAAAVKPRAPATILG